MDISITNNDHLYNACSDIFDVYCAASNYTTLLTLHLSEQQLQELVDDVLSAARKLDVTGYAYIVVTRPIAFTWGDDVYGTHSYYSVRDEPFTNLEKDSDYVKRLRVECGSIYFELEPSKADEDCAVRWDITHQLYKHEGIKNALSAWEDERKKRYVALMAAD